VIKITKEVMMNFKLMRDYISRHPVVFVALAYFVIATFLTGGIIFHLDSVLFGDYGDTRGVIWAQWAKNNGFLDSPVNHLIAAPFGVPTVSGFSTPVGEWLNIILNKVGNEIAAYNLYVYISFPLTAFATYLFLNKLLHNYVAAFVGGLIFGFCPGAVMQAAGGHAAFAFNVFIPIFLAALFNNRAQRTILSAFYVAISYSLIVFSALYFGYLAIYIALFFVAFDLLSCRSGNRMAIVLNSIYGVIFAVILILPFEYKAIYQQLTFSSEVLVKSGHIRDFNELAVYSSRFWEFLTPSIDHPILGKLIYDFARTHLHGSNVFEQSLYLGVIPIGLFLMGFVLIARGKFDTDRKTYFLFFAFGGLWMYFLSMPPLISIGDVHLPTASYFAYNIAPMFRVYARFGILVNFFVACSVAVVLTYIFQKATRARYLTLLAVLLPLLCFEYWSVPLGYALPINKPPEVYQWLSKEPKDVIVAEYPMMKSDEASFYSYLFWQRVHKKALVNGAAPDNVKAWEFFEKIKDLESPHTSELLKSAGVKYVIVHGEMYKEGAIPPPLKRYYAVGQASTTYNDGRIPAIPFSLTLVKVFGTDFVFSLEKSENTRSNLSQQKNYEANL